MLDDLALKLTYLDGQTLVFVSFLKTGIAAGTLYTTSS
jgi:hypothetical protein